MQTVVVGAGVGGLGSALGLARTGHTVTVLEHDTTPPPSSVDEAFAWDRRGAPQVRHSHAFLARLRNLLRDRYPDVLEDLLAAGAREMRFADMLPDTILDRSSRAGDEDLVALACRRTTFEWVLRRAVAAEEDVRLLGGVTVEGLDVVAPAGAAPVVSGVRMSGRGPLRSLAADLVVVAGGRRSPLPDWLGRAGIELDEQVEDTGIVYFSRFYRLHRGVRPPPRSAPIAGDLGYCKYAVFDGDNDTFSVTLACGVDDADLRRRFGRDDGFERSAAALAATAPWVAAEVSEPITDVHLMAGLVNRRRRFVHRGEPVVLGMHAVGDAHTCTNPLYGRGCSLAMVQAVALTDAVAEHPDDARARSLAYEAVCEREVLPWYRAAVAQDRHATKGEDGPVEPGAGGDAPDIRALVRDGLMPAVRTDPHVYRAFVRSFNLLDLPEALMVDPDVVQPVLTAYQDRASRPAEAALGPDRATLLAC